MTRTVNPLQILSKAPAVLEVPSYNKTYATISDQTSTGNGLNGVGDGRRGSNSNLPENLAYGRGERSIGGAVLMVERKEANTIFFRCNIGYKQSRARNLGHVLQLLSLVGNNSRSTPITDIHTSVHYLGGGQNIAHFI
jgi:hypothetical protein